MAVRKVKNSWWVDFQIDKRRYRKRSPVNSKIGATEYEAFLRQKIARGESIDNTEKEKKQAVIKEMQRLEEKAGSFETDGSKEDRRVACEELMKAVKALLKREKKLQ